MVLEAYTDPDVPPLPPHITLAQAKVFPASLPKDRSLAACSRTRRRGRGILVATMNRGVGQLQIAVVPDSGTGELGGLTGTMNIIRADGQHSYEFEYSIPD